MLDDCRLIFANASSWCATEVWYPSSQDLTAMYQLHRWNVSVGGGWVSHTAAIRIHYSKASVLYEITPNAKCYL